MKSKIYSVVLGISCLGLSPIASAALAVAAPSYGAFAQGGINNSYGQPPSTPGVSSGGGAFYYGTDYITGNPSTGSASGSVGDTSWGMSSASANLATGDITVSTTSLTSPPYNSSPPPYGSPASATAGYFVELTFSGGQGQLASVSMGGLASYSGDVSVTAGVEVRSGTFSGMPAGYSIVSGTDLAPQSNVAWSAPTYQFNIEDGVTYTLAAMISIGSSGQFLPGTATFNDPLTIILPQGASYTASDPGFLSAPVPEPDPLALALLGLGFIAAVVRLNPTRARI